MGGWVELLITLVLILFGVPLVLLVVALASVRGLKQRVAALEARMRQLEGEAAPASTTPSPVPLQRVAEAELPLPTVPVHKPLPTALPPRPLPPPIPLDAVSAAEAGSPTPAPTPAPAMQRQLPAPEPGVFERALLQVKNWFTRGNVPVKVGMLVLLAGVAALLRYASQQGWVHMPMEYRLAAIALAAVAALVFGWRKRDSKPQFALAVQGGAIGVLLLVVFAAAKLYALLPPALAFALSVGLIAGTAVLAVLQNSRTLAVLAVLAGFMAPIWLASGSGNHVALFAYYALLNLGIFAIVWVKPWRGLMLLGFAFTWGIGTLWGVLSYHAGLYASAQAFLLLFFLIYLLMPILHARRQVPGRGDYVNGSLLFAMPLLAFGLQAGLMAGNRIGLAWAALAVAVTYALLAFLLRGRERFRVLADAHALLAVAFATLAIPLAFSANVSAGLLALEGAALVWLGLRQQRALSLYAGLGLQLLAALAFQIAREDAAFSRWQMTPEAWQAALGGPLLNALAMAGLLIALSALLSAWLLWRARRTELAALLYGWGLLHWLLLWHWEITRFASNDDDRLACYLLLATGTAWLAAEAWRRWQGRLLVVTVLLALGACLPLHVLGLMLEMQVFGWVGLAWLAWALLGWRSLQCLRSAEVPEAGLAQLAWWLGWPLLLTLWVNKLLPDGLDAGWRFAAHYLPWLAALALSLRGQQVLMQPLGSRFAPWLPWFMRLCLLPVGLGLLGSFFSAGGAAPLPWLPLMNPLELMQLLALLLLVDALRQHHAGRAATIALGLLALVWASQLVLRAAHHWGALPWSGQMFGLSLAQTSLSVLWSVLGVAGWIVGSRRGLRGLWLAAALLMAVVLLKLLLIDRQHLGNLLGIGSFIAYGLLCTVVGYFAPAPPRPEAVNKEHDG